jgi:holo-[acyl-carrier protein] synthase
MIYRGGIGVPTWPPPRATARSSTALERHGERTLEKFLAPGEREACRSHHEPGRFLAKRFAAKEALGKALAPASANRCCCPRSPSCTTPSASRAQLRRALAADYIAERRLTAHLSISDEGDHARRLRHPAETP